MNELETPQTEPGQPRADVERLVKRPIVEKVRAGDFRSAIRTGLNYLKDNPPHPKAADVTGWAYQQYATAQHAAGETKEAGLALEEAEGRYRQALACKPDYASANQHLNSVEAQKLYAAEEPKALKETIDHPDNAPAYLYYIRLLLSQNKFLQAFKSLSERRAEGPMRVSVDILTAFAGCEVMNSQYLPDAQRQQARDAASQAASRLPYRQKYDYLLGCLKHRGLSITSNQIKPIVDPTMNTNDCLIKHIIRLADEARMPNNLPPASYTPPDGLGLDF